MAGLAASVAVSLILGSVVSAYFAASERRVRIEIQDSATRLARRLVLPIRESGDDQLAWLSWTDRESDALWIFADLQNEPHGFQLLNESTRDPIIAKQLRARSEAILTAVVGLDMRKRAQAFRLLSDRLQEPAISPLHRAEIAFVALELLDQAGTETDLCADTIVRSLSTDLPLNLRVAWENHLTNFGNRLVPGTAARLYSAALARESNRNGPDYPMAEELVKTANTMIPAEAAKFLVAAFEREANIWTQSHFALGLTTLMGRLEREGVGNICDLLSRRLVAAVNLEPNRVARLRAVNALAEVAKRVDQAKAARICEPVARFCNRSGERRRRFPDGLGVGIVDNV